MPRHVLVPGPLSAAFHPGIAGGGAQALYDAMDMGTRERVPAWRRATITHPYLTRTGLQVAGGVVGGLSGLGMSDSPGWKPAMKGAGLGILAGMLYDGLLKSDNAAVLRKLLLRQEIPNYKSLDTGVRAIAKNTALKDALHALAGNVHRGSGNEGYVLAAQSMAEDRPAHKDSPVGLSTLISGLASTTPPPLENVLVAGNSLVRGSSAIDRARGMVSEGTLSELARQ